MPIGPWESNALAEGINSYHSWGRGLGTYHFSFLQGIENIFLAEGSVSNNLHVFARKTICTLKLKLPSNNRMDEMLS